MNIIILEDEIPAYKKLLKYISNNFPETSVIRWYRSIKEAEMEIKSFQKCDLILSDIELIDGTSFELFSKITLKCPIIFCTAYDQYLQDAFDTNGIAYLLKPYSEDNFKKAISKYLQFFGEENKVSIDKSLLASIENLIDKKKQGFKQRFSIKKQDGIILKQTSDVFYFEANGDFCFLHDNNGQRHTINYRISELEKQLDPSLFFRINRSEIVNITSIEKATNFFKNKMNIHLSNDITLTISSSRIRAFRAWFDGESI